MSCKELPPESEDTKRDIIRGVRATPIRLLMDALKIAAGTLPRAIETITTLDETVEGSVATK